MVTPGWHWYKPGAFCSVDWNYRIPSELGSTLPFLVLSMRAGPLSAYGMSESTRLFMLLRVDDKDGHNPAVQEDLLEIDSTDGMQELQSGNTPETGLLKYVVPNSLIASRPGGRVAFILQDSSLSTGPAFLVGEPRMTPRFGPLADSGLSAGWNIIV